MSVELNPTKVLGNPIPNLLFHVLLECYRDDLIVPLNNSRRSMVLCQVLILLWVVVSDTLHQWVTKDFAIPLAVGMDTLKDRAM